MKFFTLALSVSIGLCSSAFSAMPKGYSLETVTLPKGSVTILGLCHKPDGTLTVVSWEGEVWEYKDKKWSLFAKDLMEPNGIHYDAKEDAYYVAQKPELTRLVDTDKDGKCDRYECVTDAFAVTGRYHEYHYGPVVDSKGRKYGSLNLAARGDFIVPDEKKGIAGNMAYTGAWRGYAYRSDSMGHFHPVAGGFRSPCGIGVSPDDQLFITDNQGDWVAASCLFHVEEGNFYGHPASLIAREDFTKEKVLSMKAADFDKIRTKPAIMFPREVIANSPGSPVWDTTKGKFGPFAGQMFIGDQTQSNYFRCGVEKVGGALQGWAVDFIRPTESGTVKMSFDAEGRLWSAQVGRGWLSKGGKRTALQYAQWDGKTLPFEIYDISLTDTGFKVTFTERIGKMTTPQVKSWHYKYHSTYGSDKMDEKEIPVSNYKLAKDRKSISFDVPLTAGKVYSIDMLDQRNTSNEPLGNKTIYYTVNNTHKGNTTAKAEEKVAPATVADLAVAKDFVLTKGWQVSNGMILPSAKPGGFLWSKKAYKNFTISLEYKTTEKCNSGLFFRTNPKDPVQGGFEIQVASQGLYKGKHIVGSLYDAKEPTKSAGKPDGEWNKMVLTCNGSKLTVVLNDEKVQDLDLNDWDTAKKNPDGSRNKFKTPLKDLPQSGHFALQYHGQQVFYKNIIIKELP